MKHLVLAAALAALPAVAVAADAPAALTYTERPFYLIDKLPDGKLKDKLVACEGQTPKQTTFSIAHRGAPLMFPEHSLESYRAAARQGAGIFECDVTFTKDKELVCRHAQNDLHTTTNILTTPLAAKCTQPFAPAAGETKASAECRTSDITLAEFQTLTPKMDSSDPKAATPEAFQGGLPTFRTVEYAEAPHLMTLKQSIELFKSFGGKFTPELKDPTVAMPFDGFTMDDYARKMVDEFKAADVPMADVYAQTFNLSVAQYWLKNDPELKVVYLDDRDEASDDDEGPIDPMDPATFKPTMTELADMGLKYIAPPIWYLVTVEDGKIVPSAYAKAAKAAGLDIITWSLERSGPLASGGGWYFQSVKDAVKSDADYYTVLDVLAQDVGIVGIFSDWPATVTYYANCNGL